LRDNGSNFTLDVRDINRELDNRNPLFSEMLAVLGNTGNYWISPWCSIPSLFYSETVLTKINNTRIFYNTVIKRVRKDPSGRRITQVDVIQCTPRQTEERCRFYPKNYLIDIQKTIVRGLRKVDFHSQTFHLL
jgi:hypothetical protein